jgi:hypothetical protein
MRLTTITKIAIAVPIIALVLFIKTMVPSGAMAA